MRWTLSSLSSATATNSPSDLTMSTRGQLAEKNTRLDEFFDPYVNEDGSWDYDMLNMHRSVIDNIETIVQSVYKQGNGRWPTRNR